MAIFHMKLLIADRDGCRAVFLTGECEMEDGAQADGAAGLKGEGQALQEDVDRARMQTVFHLSRTLSRESLLDVGFGVGAGDNANCSRSADRSW